MASKPAAGKEPSETFDDSWLVVDYSVARNDNEIDKTVLNPMSARARSVNNFRHKLLKLKKKTPSSTTEREARRQTQDRFHQEQKSGGVGIIKRMRSKSSTIVDWVKGKKERPDLEG